MTSADEYLSNKFLEWQNRYGDYRIYIRNHKDDLKKEFENDEVFKEAVCKYLKNYAKGEEKESVLSIIQNIANPDKDVLEIIVGAILNACGYSNEGNALIQLAIVGLIGVALIALLSRKK